MTEWITHDGGPMPVAPEAIVDVKFRRGDDYHGRMARNWSWHHTRMADDIIAYRLAQPEPAAERAIRNPSAKYAHEYPPPEPLARDMTMREHMRLELTKAALTGLLAGNYKDNTDVRWVKLRAQLYAEELLAALQENHDDA